MLKCLSLTLCMGTGMSFFHDASGKQIASSYGSNYFLSRSYQAPDITYVVLQMNSNCLYNEIPLVLGQMVPYLVKEEL